MAKRRQSRARSPVARSALPSRSFSLSPAAIAVSLTVGLCLGYLVFVVFLQTPQVQIRSLAGAGIVSLLAGIGSYSLCLRWLFPALGASSQVRSLLAIGLVLPAAFLPSLYRTPAYPASPLLQAWSQITIQFQVSAGSSAPAEMPRNSIRLDLANRNLFNRHGFDASGGWQQSGDVLTLAPGSSGTLEWQGVMPQSPALTIVPPAAEGSIVVVWDGDTSTIPLHAEASGPLILSKTLPVPWDFSLSVFLSIFVVVAWLLVVILLALRSRLMSLIAFQGSRRLAWLLAAALLLLAIYALNVQIENLPGGPSFLGGEQLFRHEQIMTIQGDDPWQYRVLSDLVVEAGARLLQAQAVAQPYGVSFVAVRLLQNAAVFLLAFALYRRLSASPFLALLGILILVAVMGTVFYDSDLSFNNYFDVIFYLLAALLLLDRHYSAVVWVVFFAALNRETSVLITFMLVAATIIQGDSLRANLIPILRSAAAFVVVFVGLRLLMPGRPPFIPHGQAPGLPLLDYNLSRQLTWSNLFATLGFVPLLGLAAYNSWPRLWRAFFWIVCPAWFGAHFLLGVVAETRLFLVPQAMVFIPGVLFLLNQLLRRPQPPILTAADR